MIRAAFERLRSRGETALIPYLTAGYPSLDLSLDHARTLERHGADLLEIGVPWSDPIADGPTIQRASHDALAAGTRLRHVLDALEARRFDVPLVVMCYLNPLLALGRERVVERLGRAGVGALIVPDLPAEEAGPWQAALGHAGLALVPLVAPTTDGKRLGRVLESGDGFVYYVSLTGTTGARAELAADVPAALDGLRAATRRPVVVGFGISTPHHVRVLRDHCDGVVVGSRVVEAIRKGENLIELIESLKQATRR